MATGNKVINSATKCTPLIRNMLSSCEHDKEVIDTKSLSNSFNDLLNVERTLRTTQHRFVREAAAR